ncbi:MAG: hypothetical protein ABJK25_15160 [Halieaceae bacterium]
MINERYLTQEDLLQRLEKSFVESGRCCKKIQPVLARPAVEGERVVTITSSGVETENFARADSFVIKNLTSAGEQYIVSRKTLEGRYGLQARRDERWSEYLPVGRIMAIVVNDSVLEALQMPSSFKIMASWGQLQKVCEGDILASPLPDNKEVYRIDRKEFDQTYQYVD